MHNHVSPIYEPVAYSFQGLIDTKIITSSNPNPTSDTPIIITPYSKATHIFANVVTIPMLIKYIFLYIQPNILQV